MDLPDRVIPLFLRATRRNRPYRTVAGAQQRIEERALRPEPFGPPRRLRSDITVAVEQYDGWPLYTLRPAAAASHGAVLYVHGGGWVGEIAGQHWRLAAQIAAQARTCVLLPIYPLVPFGTAQTVNRGIVDLVLWAREQFGTVCLAGDSAGGQIALSAALTLRDEHGVVVPRTVLVTPALDLSLSHPQIPEVLPRDPWLGVDGLQHLIDVWRAELPVHDPRVSPLAADLTGLGPLTVFAGTRDILHPDIGVLRAKAAAAGVDLEVHEGSDLTHVYPLLPTKSGRAARDVIVRTLQESLASSE